MIYSKFKSQKLCIKKTIVINLLYLFFNLSCSFILLMILVFVLILGYVVINIHCSCVSTTLNRENTPNMNLKTQS